MPTAEILRTDPKTPFIPFRHGICTYLIHISLVFFRKIRTMKKRIALLSGLLLVSIVGQLLLRPCLGSETENVDLTTSSAQPKTPALMDTRDLLQEDEGDFKSDNLQGQLYQQLIMMIAFVAVIGIGVWFFCKKFSGRWNLAKGKHIIITETVNLGSRKHLHIVQLGTKQYLLSSTPDSIRLLVDVTESLEHGHD